MQFLQVATPSNQEQSVDPVGWGARLIGRLGYQHRRSGIFLVRLWVLGCILLQYTFRRTVWRPLRARLRAAIGHRDPAHAG